jgi:transposase
MKYVAVKSLFCQDLQSLHRSRSLLVKSRTSMVNQCRGLAMEYGVTMSRGINSFREEIGHVLEADNELTPVVRDVLLSLKNMVNNLDKEIKVVEEKIKTLSAQDRDYERLLDVPGVGPLTASLFLASVGSVSVFKNGRHLAAWLGVVPRQHSSGGSAKLMGITKAGDQSLRVMMVHGARALIRAVRRKNHQDPYSQWILKLLEKKGWNVTALAVANRNCRVMWHLIKYQEDYRKQIA